MPGVSAFFCALRQQCPAPSRYGNFHPPSTTGGFSAAKLAPLPGSLSSSLVHPHSHFLVRFADFLGGADDAAVSAWSDCPTWLRSFVPTATLFFFPLTAHCSIQRSSVACFVARPDYGPDIPSTVSHLKFDFEYRSDHPSAIPILFSPQGGVWQRNYIAHCHPRVSPTSETSAQPPAVSRNTKLLRSFGRRGHSFNFEIAATSCCLRHMGRSKLSDHQILTSNPRSRN